MSSSTSVSAVLAVWLLVAVVSATGASAGRINATPQRLIVDTDMGFDVDDVMAVCLANTLHWLGEVELLAVVHDTGCHLGIGGPSAINHFYGHDNISALVATNCVVDKERQSLFASHTCVHDCLCDTHIQPWERGRASTDPTATSTLTSVSPHCCVHNLSPHTVS